eukprot:scaffold3515_cov126-Cylindrotheca_fusiformis.AAC.20
MQRPTNGSSSVSFKVKYSRIQEGWATARKKQLRRPRKGATATILTRFIKPPQPMPNNDKKHKSKSILLERDKDNQNRTIF